MFGLAYITQFLLLISCFLWVPPPPLLFGLIFFLSFPHSLLKQVKMSDELWKQHFRGCLD